MGMRYMLAEAGRRARWELLEISCCNQRSADQSQAMLEWHNKQQRCRKQMVMSATCNRVREILENDTLSLS